MQSKKILASTTSGYALLLMQTPQNMNERKENLLTEKLWYYKNLYEIKNFNNIMIHKTVLKVFKNVNDSKICYKNILLNKINKTI